MATDSKNVSVGKPKAGGAVFWAPAGTAAPTNASTALASAFLDVGYISDEGVTVSTSVESTSHNAWGGDEVANDVTTYSETTAFTLLEVNENAQKLAFGSANVAANLSSVAHKMGAFTTEVVLVVETLVGAGKVRRTVVPRAKLIERGDITYVDTDLVGYPVTFANLVDSSGATSYDYYADLD